MQFHSLHAKGGHLRKICGKFQYLPQAGNESSSIFTVIKRMAVFVGFGSPDATRVPNLLQMLCSLGLRFLPPGWSVRTGQTVGGESKDGFTAIAT
ncbi:MAG: hypothetical protein GY775_06630 [Candidatus Scalindua sp.]|nr:hypothetical protein [Candidatus Scalindua sp.]